MPPDQPGQPDPFGLGGGPPDLTDLEAAFNEGEEGEQPVPSEGQPPAGDQPPAPQPAPPETPPVPPAGQEPTPPTPPQPDLGIPPELTGEEPAPEPEAEAGQEPTGPQPGEEGYLYGGRFKDVPELEQGYLQARRLHENTARERNNERLRAEQAIELARRLYPYYQAAAQQQQAQQPGQQLPPAPVPEGLDPEFARAAQPWIDQRVAQHLGSFQQRLTQEQAQQAEVQRQQQEVAAQQQAASQAITTFESTTQLDEGGRLALADAFKELDQASKAFDGTPLAITVENLTVAHEASRNPALLEQLALMPQLMDSDRGIQYARDQATLRSQAPSAPAPAGPSATPGAQAPNTRTAELRAARVESGSPLPPGEEQELPRDEWQEVLDLHKSQAGQASPVLGV